MVCYNSGHGGQKIPVVGAGAGAGTRTFYLKPVIATFSGRFVN